MVRAKIGLAVDAEMTRKDAAAYQMEQLRITLDRVKSCSPFYRQHFAGHSQISVQNPRDLAQWPLTTADDLGKDSLAFLCISQSRVERVVTLPDLSGTGSCRRLFFSASDLELAVDFFRHGFGALAPGQRMLVMMPGQSQNSVGDLISRALARLSVHALAQGPMQSPETVVNAVLSHHIDTMVGIPSDMAALVRHPGAIRIPPGQIKSIWLGTQNTRRSAAAEIGCFFACPVIQHYGPAELCPGVGVECGYRNGFHLREADLFVEIIEPQTARPVEDGAWGEVVVTTLTREAMPLVRYRTGHRAALMTQPCACGSGLRRLSAVGPCFKQTTLRKGAILNGSHHLSGL